jgi:general L-amino acid transport system permease protein
MLCFPLGIMLALGRRCDSMPIVKYFCIAFIEFWRGVPLITILFMAAIMLPLLLPEGTQFDKLGRALIGIVLFEAAYIAEVIRGGLQAIPRGQYEAADSLNLTYWKKTGLIIMPQTLKLVIPGIVNNFIALLKDTSLVSIIGMWDLLNSAIGSTRDPKWIGFIIEAYVFAGIIYWIMCFGTSKYSQHLEKKLNTTN